MDCSAPPPLTDDQISAVLDGAAEGAVLAHLAGCASCAARLEDARRVERTLRDGLHRWDCPAPQTLADYHLARVGAEQDRAIARHLAGCARCAAEIETLRLFLLAGEPAPAPPPVGAPRRAGRPARGPLLARILPRSLAPTLRGGGGPLMAEADGLTIFVDVQPAGAGQVALECQLVADDQQRWTGALVEIRQSGALRATAEVDDLGGFRCAAIPAGATELRITPPGGRMLVVPGLELIAAAG